MSDKLGDLCAGEDLQIGDMVCIRLNDGKVYKHRPGVDGIQWPCVRNVKKGEFFNNTVENERTETN